MTDDRTVLARFAGLSTLGAVLYAVCQGVTLVLIARFGGNGDVATFFLAQAVATPLANFGSLRLKEQFAVENPMASFLPRVYRSLGVLALVSVVAVLGWLVFASKMVAGVGAFVMVANSAQMAIYAYQGRENAWGEFRAPAISEILMGATSIIAILLGYVFGNSLLLGSALLAMSWMSMAVVLLRRTARRDRAVGGFERSSVSLSEDLSVGLSGMSQVGQVSAARIGIGWFAGSVALANLGTASFLVRAGSVVVVGVRAAVAPRLGEMALRSPRSLRHLSNRLTLLAIPLAMVSSLFGFTLGQPLIRVGFGDEISPDPIAIALVFGSASFLYAAMVISQVVIALDGRRHLAMASLGGLLVTVAAVVPLSYFFGEVGAAATIAVGYLVRYGLTQRAVPQGVEAGAADA